MPEEQINPITLDYDKSPPLHQSFSGNLDGNKQKLKDNLWRSLFKIRLMHSNYDIPDEGVPMTVKRKPTSNKFEKNAVQEISGLCKEEAIAIVDALYNWLVAARKTVQSEGENHSTENYLQFEVHEVSSTDQCGIDF